MNEEPVASPPESAPDVASPSEPAKPASPRRLNPEVLARWNPPRPAMDRTPMVLVGIFVFLAFMFGYYIYTYWTSSRLVKTVVVKPTPDMYPVTKLLSADHIQLLDEGGGKAEIGYRFEQAGGDRHRMDQLLKDWRGARNDLDRVRTTGREHERIQWSEKGLPLTPLLSAVSFDGDLEFSVDVEATKPVQMWFFFHCIYDYEVTGTALVISPEGEAQFVRYRRELAFDEPRGKSGKLALTPGVRQTVRIVLREFPLRAGFRCAAFDGGREVTRADFAPEWGEDRRYHPSQIGRSLVADFRHPPQAGFLAVISDPASAVRLYRIDVTGTVAEAWRAQRTQTRKILEEPLKPADSARPASTPVPP